MEAQADLKAYFTAQGGARSLYGQARIERNFDAHFLLAGAVAKVLDLSPDVVGPLRARLVKRFFRTIFGENLESVRHLAV